MKSRLRDNEFEIQATHSKGKFVVAERLNKNLKNKIYKYMTSVSKNAYTDKLDYIVNKYNNAYQRTIKMKSIGVKVEYIYWLWCKK